MVPLNKFNLAEANWSAGSSIKNTRLAQFKIVFITSKMVFNSKYLKTGKHAKYGPLVVA